MGSGDDAKSSREFRAIEEVPALDKSVLESSSVEGSSETSTDLGVSLRGPNLDAQHLHPGLERRLRDEWTADEQVVLDKWSSVRDYSDLISLNREYLQGKLPFSYYYVCSIYSETIPLVPGLLTMHDFGMLTFMSQPSTTEMMRVCKCMGGVHKLTQQQSFVTFALPENAGRIDEESMGHFLYSLIQSEEMYVHITWFKNRCPEHEGGAPAYISTLPQDWYTHRLVDYDENPKEYCWTRMFEPHMQCCCMFKEFYTDVDAINKIQFVIVHVLAKDKEEENLPGKIVEAAEMAGMKRVYKVESD